MKKIIAVFTFIVFAGIIQAHAQQTPVADHRQKNQRHRIQSGVASGELTRRETASARCNQRRIKKSERRAKADGVVTPIERARLDHKQDRASRQLRRDKHDGQDRPYANN
ncbi:MAG TPA: hypothetical protein VFG46_14580 [Chryseolinea sp.]|nr:hypothetical protein [Chryseolinea sp.]